jgi:hypothetical protein
MTGSALDCINHFAGLVPEMTVPSNTTSLLPSSSATEAGIAQLQAKASFGANTNAVARTANDNKTAVMPFHIRFIVFPPFSFDYYVLHITTFSSSGLLQGKRQKGLLRRTDSR